MAVNTKVVLRKNNRLPYGCARSQLRSGDGERRAMKRYISTAFAILITSAMMPAAASADSQIDPWAKIIPVAPQSSVEAPTVPVPHYDSIGYCNHWNNGNGTKLRDCLNEQQESYNNVKALWSSVSAPSRDQCDKEAHNGDGAGYGSYYILFHCAIRLFSADIRSQQDHAAAEDAKNFKFKY
jgi:hypothetical protein